VKALFVRVGVGEHGRCPFPPRRRWLWGGQPLCHANIRATSSIRTHSCTMTLRPSSGEAELDRPCAQLGAQGGLAVTAPGRATRDGTRPLAALSGNSAGFGGAISSTGALRVSKSVITNNTAVTDGGGIYTCCGGTVTLDKGHRHQGQHAEQYFALTARRSSASSARYCRTSSAKVPCRRSPSAIRPIPGQESSSLWTSAGSGASAWRSSAASEARRRRGASVPRGVDPHRLRPDQHEDDEDDRDDGEAMITMPGTRARLARPRERR